MLTLEMYAGIIYPSKLITANGGPGTRLYRCTRIDTKK